MFINAEIVLSFDFLAYANMEHGLLVPDCRTSHPRDTVLPESFQRRMVTLVQGSIVRLSLEGRGNLSRDAQVVH